MTKVDIISGFLGAGKTTLIKKLIKEALGGTKVVLIENEFGEIGIDGGFLKEAGIKIREMNSGCICCSLVGDFQTSLQQVMDQYAPERILIEPSGVGKLDDVMRAIENAAKNIPDMKLNSAVTVVDATKAKLYFKNFGEFFRNQIENAGTVVITRADKASQEQMDTAIEIVRSLNPKAALITTPLDQISGKQILDTFEGKADLQQEILGEVLNTEEEHHHHHHHDDHAERHVDEDGNVIYRAHEHHHDEDEDEDEHEHHHDHDDHDHDDHDDHDHDEHDHEGHDHDEHEHHHHDHEDHDADDVFKSWGMETPNKYTKEEVTERLNALNDTARYGFILRAKGMLPGRDGEWIHFDFTPEESDVRSGSADVTGKICVIGSDLNQDNLETLWKVAKN